MSQGCDRSSLRCFTQIKIGSVWAKTQVSGTLPTQTIVNGRLTAIPRGKVIIAGTDTFLLRDTVVNVAGGTVRWLLMVAGIGQRSRCPGGRLASSASVTGTLGTFKLSGTTESFKPETSYWFRTREYSRWHSYSLKHPVAGGRWQGSGTAGIQLGRILPQLPPQLQDASTVGSTVVLLRLHPKA